LNGVFLLESNVAYTLPDTTVTAAKVIGGGATGSALAATETPTTAIAMYDVEKNPAQVASIHEALANLATPHMPKKHMWTGIGSLGSTTPAVSAWNMEVQNGVVADEVGVNHGTPTSGLCPALTPWGEPTICFNNGANPGGRISCGSHASLNFITETFGFSCWVKLNSILAHNPVLQRGFFSVDGYVFYIAATQKIAGITFQPGASQVGLSTTSIEADRWYNIAFLSVAAGENIVYINAEQDGATPARVDPVTTIRNFYMGARDPGEAIQELDGLLARVVVSTPGSRAEFEAQLQVEYNRVARHVVYHEDFESSYETFTAIGAGSFVPGTKIEIISGTWKVVWDSVLKKLVLECQTAGGWKVLIPRGNEIFGTLKTVTKNADALSSIQTYLAPDPTTTKGYSIGITAEEAFMLENAATLFQSNETYSSSGYHTLSLAATTEGVRTARVNGDLPTAQAGANPATDTTYAAASYIYGEANTAGDRISEFTKFFGVVP